MQNYFYKASFLKYCAKRRLLVNVQRFKWTSTVGLEIHAQLATNTKLFSGASTGFGLPVNSCVNLMDIAVPGSLPILNKKCVELAVLASQALGCSLSSESHFDRKHYFYADMPSGYQITQQRTPIATSGCLEFYVYNPGTHKTPIKKRCRLKQIQIEQDSGKSLHDSENRTSLIDINRAGMGLLEFVFEPDLNDGEEAAALVKELALILEKLEICSCKMEEGALRIDANVSISNKEDKLGVRTEIKNIGSVRGVANAIMFEVERQLDVVKKGGVVVNETRGWDPANKKTIPMRQKELVHDYRFMPEPNLPPLRISCHPSEVANGALDVTHLISAVHELPAESRATLIQQYGFTEVYAILLVNQPMLLDLFKKMMAENADRNAKLAWNVLMVQLLNVLHNNEIEVESMHLNAKHLGGIVDLLQMKVIDFEACRDILDLILKGSDQTPLQIVEANHWQLISDMDVIKQICAELIQRNPKAVKKVQKGKAKALQSIVNDAGNISTGRLDMSLVAKTLKDMIYQA